MLNLFRVLKFGTINLLGITVPGFLLLFFVLTGFFLPMTVISLLLSQNSFTWIESLWRDNKLIFIILVIIFSYVFGYILRLTSPDKLDEVSGKKVIAKMDEDGVEKGEDQWPYTGDKGDKFPYYNFRNYLQVRGHKELLEHVTWGPDNGKKKSQNNNNPNEGVPTKRSKTAIHKMKLDVRLYCPELSLMIDSAEAHIRLMSGTWTAIKATSLLVLIGSISSLIACFFIYTPNLVFSHLNHRDILGIFNTAQARDNAPNCLVVFFISLSVLGVMQWARIRIEELFHIRRINELFHIVLYAHSARQRKKSLEKEKAIPHQGWFRKLFKTKGSETSE